jgi:hypothetical protein
MALSTPTARLPDNIAGVISGLLGTHSANEIYLLTLSVLSMPKYFVKVGARERPLFT